MDTSCAIYSSENVIGSYRPKSNIPNFFPFCKKIHSITCIVIGIMVSVGGFFLLLAALEVLPYGINAISELEVRGKIIGGTILGFGVLGIIYGLASQYLSNTCAASMETTQNESESIRIFAEGAERRFHKLNRDYESFFEKLPKDNEASRNFLKTAWNELDAFAQSYPEFRSRVPERPFQNKD